MCKRTPVFVALEGLRGCGKSTIAPLLARRLDARQLSALPAEYDAPRALLDSTSRNPHARAHLFLSAMLVTADRARELLAAGTSVIVDSFFARTLATHRAYGADIDFVPPAWPAPVMILLECSPEERLRRLLARTKSTTWWDELADQRSERIEQEYRKFSAHRVDTTGRRPEQTVEELLPILSRPL